MVLASEKKILVVDDEPDIRNFLAACIEDAGFRVETAKDGFEALEMIEADPPDLMTLDMVMPRKTGIQVMRTLRANEKYAKLPVIIITAHANDEFGNEDFKGFNAFTSGLRPRYIMEKPITHEKMVAAIIDILGVEPVDIEHTEVTEEKEAIIQCIKDGDAETLKKIQDLLKIKPDTGE